MTISLDDYDENITRLDACLGTSCHIQVNCDNCVLYCPPGEPLISIKEYKIRQLNQLLGTD
jgi:Pyruvate/2-oxoacid:ferredoxin oxidoreductase delta subunit